MRTIMFDYEVYDRKKVLVKAGSISFVSGATHADLFVLALRNLRKLYPKCRVRGNNVQELTRT